jgi:AraC family transcriptional regulator
MRRIIPDLLHGRDIELVHREGISDPVLRELVFKLQAELAAGCPTGPLVGESLCTHIAVEIAKNYSIEHIRFEHYKGGLSKPSLRRVLEYIDAFIDHDLTVDTLAKLAGLSRYHFGKMFKQSTGTTLHRYVLTRRIRRAEQLLRSSKSPLADVAAAVGFPNQSHFTTAFRQVIGTTPGEYRVST